MTIKEILDDYKETEKVVVQEKETKQILFYGDVKNLRSIGKEYLDKTPLITVIKDDIKFLI